MFNNRKYHFINSLKDELGRLFIISFGVFLFILFFQPFPLGMLDYNNRLLFVTGFGAITFFLACLVLIILPILFPSWCKTNEWESGPPLLLYFFLIAITATAFAFYIRYVGGILLSFYIMFKVLLVCLIPIINLIILYKNKALEREIDILQEQNKHLFAKIKNFEKVGEEEEIDIISENKSDKLTLKYKNIAFIKSADNYIEIYYLENDLLVKKLLRNTLKNIELQLAHQRCFIRCHRTCLVNNLYITKLVRSYSGYSLKLSCQEDRIPVSRQYIIPVKAAIVSME